MANSRLITSAIWEDEWFGELDFFEQALWIGLFSKCADDQGRLLNNPTLIRAAVFPYKDVPLSDITTLLNEAAASKKAILYEADGKALVQIVRWWQHQKPQWACESKYASPPGWTDRIRTRQGGKYRAINWFDPKEYIEPEDKVPDNLADTRCHDNPVGHISSISINTQTIPDGIVCRASDGGNGHQDKVGPIPEPEPVKEKTVDTRKEQKPVAKRPRGRPADPRHRHPAILCYYRVTERKPAKVLLDKIIAVVGDHPDEGRMLEAYQSWVAMGYKPTNLNWLFDWYLKGMPANTRASPGPVSTGKSARDEAIRAFASEEKIPF